MSIDICGEQAVHVPTNECGECSGFESRVKALEDRVAALELLLTGMEQITISMTDSNDDTVEISVLGSVLE